MDRAFVTIKLTVAEVTLMLDKLRQSQQLNEQHAKLKPESPQMRKEQQKSRADALLLKDIIDTIEGR
jgi:hypothetical protein